jgi:diketogulonate reductase-like aldo/keto reductase
MEKAVAMGKVRVLGISDFDASDEVFDKIMRESVVKPAVLQMECHPYAQRLAMREKAKRYGIYVTSWFPLGGAMSKGALLKEERFFNMSLEEKERAYLGNMQIPAERK